VKHASPCGKPRLGVVRIPGPDHPITIEAANERIVVRAAGRIVAETTSALRLDEAGHRPVYYVPMADVDAAVLERSATSTYCPFKGTASYYSIVIDGRTIADAVWVYEQPYESVDAIASRVAFYPHLVEISALAA
jgi:uncharacterized protein (DUF427 family)